MLYIAKDQRYIAWKELDKVIFGFLIFDFYLVELGKAGREEAQVGVRGIE